MLLFDSLDLVGKRGNKYFTSSLISSLHAYHHCADDRYSVSHLDVLEEAAVESGAIDHHVAPVPLDQVAGSAVAGLRVVPAVVQPLGA